MENFKFVPHKKCYSGDYQRFINNLARINSKKFEGHHVGSTSVLGLGGKGIIDVLICVRNWKESENIINSLNNVGIIYRWPRTNGRIFLSNKKKNSREGDFHIHIVRKGTKQHNDIIRFRNILRQNNLISRDYKKVKILAFKLSKGNRFCYKHFKERFIKTTLDDTPAKADPSTGSCGQVWRLGGEQSEPQHSQPGGTSTNHIDSRLSM